MVKISQEAEKIMAARFGKDTVIALATVENGMPYVRNVNAYYEDGAFYIITHALSNKMKHIKNCPAVAIAGEWFTAHGTGIDLGYWGRKENHRIAEKLKAAFAAWIDIVSAVEKTQMAFFHPVGQWPTGRAKRASAGYEAQNEAA